MWWRRRPGSCQTIVASAGIPSSALYARAFTTRGGAAGACQRPPSGVDFAHYLPRLLASRACGIAEFGSIESDTDRRACFTGHHLELIAAVPFGALVALSRPKSMQV